MAFATIRYATLRTPLRSSAYRLRKIADPLYVIGISEPGSLRVFLCFKNAHNYAAWRCLRLDVLVPAQYAHPALERSPVESGLAFDLAITDRRPSEHPTGAAGLVRLPQNQPPVQPDCRAHPREVAFFEQHASESRVEVFFAHTRRGNQWRRTKPSRTTTLQLRRTATRSICLQPSTAPAVRQPNLYEASARKIRRFESSDLLDCRA